MVPEFAALAASARFLSAADSRSACQLEHDHAVLGHAVGRVRTGG